MTALNFLHMADGDRILFGAKSKNDNIQFLSSGPGHGGISLADVLKKGSVSSLIVPGQQGKPKPFLN
jgi:hypothetical protein